MSDFIKVHQYTIETKIEYIGLMKKPIEFTKITKKKRPFFIKKNQIQAFENGVIHIKGGSRIDRLKESAEEIEKLLRG